MKFSFLGVSPGWSLAIVYSVTVLAKGVFTNLTALFSTSSILLFLIDPSKIFLTCFLTSIILTLVFCCCWISYRIAKVSILSYCTVWMTLKLLACDYYCLLIYVWLCTSLFTNSLLFTKIWSKKFSYGFSFKLDV